VFPRLRWVGLAWLVIWVPAYATTWGWRNFLQLCDVAVFLTVLSLWRASPVVLGSQLAGSLVVGILWTLDAGARLILGAHLLGGTEYMWDARWPLGVRLLSLFHVGLPLLLLHAVRRAGYHRRALVVEVVIVAVVLLASRLLGEPAKNPNYVFRDPFLGRAFGPAIVHLAVVLGVFTAVVLVPTHVVLMRVFRPVHARVRPPSP
jgi:hypothetical protein